jgi:hypothetical protein
VHAGLYDDIYIGEDFDAQDSGNSRNANIDKGGNQYRDIGNSEKFAIQGKDT